jgi:ribonuclease PH
MSQQLRSLFVEYANLSHADASAVFCQGRAVIQAIVNGPEEMSANREDSEKAIVSINYRKAVGGSKGTRSFCTVVSQKADFNALTLMFDRLNRRCGHSKH